MSKNNLNITIEMDVKRHKDTNETNTVSFKLMSGINTPPNCLELETEMGTYYVPIHDLEKAIRTLKDFMYSVDPFRQSLLEQQAQMANSYAPTGVGRVFGRPGDGKA